MEFLLIPRKQHRRDTKPIPLDELRRLLKEMNEGESERTTVRALSEPVPEWAR